LSLRPRDKAPGININVNVNANPIAENDFDVVLTLSAKAADGKDVLFNAELVYGGVFRIEGFPQEHLLPLLFIECPRLLFPFARQIIAEATRNGGFPPLMIDPIDFAQMFQQRMAEEQAKAQVS
jgi:preprotein translocase subunit SecB